MDRDILFEKFLDNLELYFDYKRDLNRKVKQMWASEANAQSDPSYPEAIFWEEYEQLYNLRRYARAALDEYVATVPETKADL